jgi:hypothetical protein
VGDLIEIVGDVHHIFPRKYLIKQGITERNKYNQIANFTYLDPQINKAIGDESPNIYFSNAFKACETGRAKLGNIMSKQDLERNLITNAIPLSIVDMDYTRYDEFLSYRRLQMAKKIRQYYNSL